MPFVSSTPQTGEGILRDNASDAAEIASSKPRIELKDLVPSSVEREREAERERELAKLRADRSYNETTGLLELQVKRPDGSYSQLQLDPKYLVDAPPAKTPPQTQQPNPRFRVSPQAAQYPEHAQYHDQQQPAHNQPPAHTQPAAHYPPAAAARHQEEPADWSPPRNREAPSGNAPRNTGLFTAASGVEEHALSQRLEDIEYEVSKQSPEPEKHRALIMERERILVRLEQLVPRRDMYREVHPCQVPRVTVPARPKDVRQAANDSHALWQHFGVKSTRSPGYFNAGGLVGYPRGATYPTVVGTAKQPVAAPAPVRTPGSVKMPAGSVRTEREAPRSSSRSHRRRRSSPDGASSRRRRRSTSRG